MAESLRDTLAVVTGAGGFIGSHLVEALLARGAHVRALTHYNAMGSVGNLAELPEEYVESRQLEIIPGDVCDRRCMGNLVGGAERVFHLAALIGIPYSYGAPESYVETNVRGTLNLLEACRDKGVGRVLHTSTSEVYGTARATPMDERHPLQSQSPYSASKIGADKLAEAYIHSFDLPLTTVRPFNTYGPRQSLRGIVPTIMTQALAEDCREIRLGSLDPVRDLTFVEDTVRAFCEIAEAPLKIVGGRLYNLGTGTGISIGDLARKIQKIAGSDKPIVEDRERVRPEASEVRRLIGNPERVKREVGWQATVSLEDGLKRTLEWLRENPAPSRSVREYSI